jgi:hypothetical protein
MQYPTDFVPASTPRTARGSLRNRCHERSRCALPGEALLHANDTREGGWLGPVIGMV